MEGTLEANVNANRLKKLPKKNYQYRAMCEIVDVSQRGAPYNSMYCNNVST